MVGAVIDRQSFAHALVLYREELLFEYLVLFEKFDVLELDLGVSNSEL
jgi:hypothetical protein